MGEGYYANLINQSPKELIERIKNLENEVFGMKIKNYEIEKLNKQLILELKYHTSKKEIQVVIIVLNN
jgi:hypothetical protein